MSAGALALVGGVIQTLATMPLFDAGRNLGNLRDARATRDAMLANYEKAIQTAFRDVADAIAREATIDDQLTASGGSIDR